MKKDVNYLFIFLLGIFIVLAIHYFIILRFNLHPTLQVLISFILFWIWLGIIAFLPKKRKDNSAGYKFLKTRK